METIITLEQAYQATEEILQRTDWTVKRFVDMSGVNWRTVKALSTRSCKRLPSRRSLIKLSDVLEQVRERTNTSSKHVPNPEYTEKGLQYRYLINSPYRQGE